MDLLVPISNRTNYSKLKPILAKLKGLDFGLIVSSSMLLEKYGAAIQDLKNDGMPIVGQVECLLSGDSTQSMSITSGLSMIGHAQWYSHFNPKSVLITGDRFDMLSAAVSAHNMNIPILHLQGGEKSGSIDNSVRDMISICATEHYAATDASAFRLQTLTNSKNIYNFGCPAVEIVSSVNVGNYFTEKNIKKQFKNPLGISDGEDYILIVVHPVTNDHESIDMSSILQASLSFNMKCVVFYPNTDAFNAEIVSSIREYGDKLILIKHAPLEDFVLFMAHARCMVGNSSAGIRESASFGTPCVNVGNRQIFRERNKNTVDCSTDKNEIIKAIHQSLIIKKYPIHNIYYKANSSENICNRIINFIRG